MTGALRVMAATIGVAAAVDPAVTLTGAARARVAVVVTQPSADAVRAAARLQADLEREYDVVRDVVSDAAAAIVVGDRYPTETLPDSLIVSTVTMAPGPSKGVRIVRADAPRGVPPATAIRIDADVAGDDLAGQTTELTARVAGVEVGRVSHAWTANRERWRAALDAVPAGEPPFVVRLEAVQRDGAGAAADVVVQLRSFPIRVEFYEPRPSWTSTFVRRALESDPRFRVESLTFSSRGLAARTPEAVPIEDPRLETFDAVVVGGLDALTAADVRALDRYVRVREGAAVLLPDQRIDRGAARELMPNATERLLERPVRLRSGGAAALEASELLLARDLPPAADIIAATADDSADAVVASLPRGGGRLVVSGALDAWRFRALDNAAFDRFWRSTIAGLALAVPPDLDVAVVPPILRPNETAEVVLRVRTSRPASVSAVVDGLPVRLVPDAEVGVYRGRIAAPPSGGRMRVDARAFGAGGAPPMTAQRIVPVVRDARAATPDFFAPLALLSASHKGIDVSPDRIDDVERFVRRVIVPPRERIVRRPMRSPWWMLPFAACLAADWWHRRRRGLR